MTVKVSSIGLKGLEGYRVQVEVRPDEYTPIKELDFLLHLYPKLRATIPIQGDSQK
ncbi:hypothetical protein RCG17_11545 [Neobacillus sp. PS3-12]|uniref:hypothetical protein n=1 Tax=Neobacillus sp. PS3-12 TaxID=3070677 RepID=UPI0027DEF757|nr:hypothetical protein [Neobacillus sp. PS3-12]WML55158.1 hypothetical protein RCG17_11545 [Neobacillus sp. PS3-12]